MALFGRKTASAAAKAPADVKTMAGKPEGKDEKKETSRPAVVPTTPSSSGSNDLAHVLRNPRITEKATMHHEIGVYTFDVSDRATKRSIVSAVAAFYKVTPKKVRIVTVPSKQKRNARTGQSGATRAGKKAYVYLKKGETITIT